MEGYQGLASVKVTPSATGVGDIAALSIELTGQGAPSTYTYVAAALGTVGNPDVWKPSFAYSAANYYVTNGAAVLYVTTTGTSGTVAPTNPAVGSSVTDNTVTWKRSS